MPELVELLMTVTPVAIISAYPVRFSFTAGVIVMLKQVPDRYGEYYPFVGPEFSMMPEIGGGVA